MKPAQPRLKRTPANGALPARFSPYVRLKDMIYQGQLTAGKRLVERELAEMLMISRIPLREALIRLQSEGLVRSERNTGAYVVDFSPQDLAEIYSIRRVLEPFASRLATERKDKRELLQELRDICARMTELSSCERDWDRLDECDFEFHWTIVQASQHSRLIRAYEMSQIRILGRRDEYRYLARVDPAATARIHLDLVEIIASGVGTKAEKATFDHVDRSMQTFLRTHGLGKA